jgi:hypothetical protein
MTRRLVLALLVVGPSLLSSPAGAQSPITVNGTGSTFIIDFTVGFTQPRADTIAAAAQRWADTVTSSVPIRIEMRFEPLSCSASSAVLGSAGTTSIHFNFPNAPFPDTYYSQALANALSGTDRLTGVPDIRARFNSEIDNPARANDCLVGIDWHYGTTPAPPGTTSFFQTVLHEIGHGLGFQTFADFGGSGALLSNRDDQFTHFLRDAGAGIDLDKTGATDAQRQAAATKNGSLVWTGTRANAEAAGFLTNGLNGTQVRMYAPTTFRSGSSISHFDSALTPNELMEPRATGTDELRLTLALFEDIGWRLSGTPRITAQSTLSTNEDTPITLAVTDFTVDDPDSVYPTDFTLTVEPGTDYTSNGTTVTPAADFNGPLTVSVRVNDGTSDSPSFDATIDVVSVNDPPVITAASSFTIDEDTSLTLSVADFTIDDPDDATFTLSVGSGTDYSVNGTTVTPDPDFNGTLTVPVSVDDGEDSSASLDVVVTVNPVNDPPSIAGQGVSPLGATEDTPFTLGLGDLAVSDVDGPGPLTLSIRPGTDYTANGLTVTPAPDFSGLLTVRVVVNDGLADSAPFDVAVQVAPVNDPPVIAGQQPLSVNEDGALTIQPGVDLTVADPDGPSVSVALASGPNYSVNGLVVTPDPDYAGPLIVPAVASDGQSTSPSFPLAITVVPVNDRPVITASPSPTTPEDTSLPLSLSDFAVTDVDTPASGLTLVLAAGANYSVSGTTITPAPDYTGTLSVPVRVDDGTDVSDPVTVSVTVTPVNDAPVITAQSPLVLDEDTSLNITPADLTITDPDDGSFTLRLFPGTDYAVAGTTLTPTADFSGVLTVGVAADDGEDEGPRFDLTVTVTPVNDAPRITAGPSPRTDEDTPVSVRLSDFTVEDPDDSFPADFSLQLRAGPNSTVTGSEISPAADFEGTLTVEAVVNDGEVDSDPFAFDVVVDPVNDPPIIEAQRPLALDEDGSLTLSPADFTITDVDDPSSNLTVRAVDGPNYQATGDGIRPAADFAGRLTVEIVANDGQDDGPPFFADVDVRSVADPPIIVAQEDLVVDEDTPFVLDVGRVTIEDPDSTEFTLRIGPGTDYTVAGNEVTPAPDTFGQLVIDLAADDGDAVGPSFGFRVTVRPVNDAPTIVGQEVLSTVQGEPLEVRRDDLRIVDPDGPEPLGIVLQAGSGYQVQGSTVTPDADFTGMLSVPVTASDGSLTSPPFSLAIAVADAGLAEPLVVDAVGVFTPRPDFAAPAALGVLTDPVSVDLVEADQFLRPGRTAIVWREVDAEGQEAFVAQRLDVRPIVSLGPSYRTSEGTESAIRVALNGPTPEPLTVTLRLDGSATQEDHGLPPTALVLAAGSVGAIRSFTPTADDQPEGEEVLFGSFEPPVAPNADPNDGLSITIDDAPGSAPLRVAVEQDGRVGAVVFRDGGPIRIGADAENATFELPSGVEGTPDADGLRLDPSALPSSGVVVARTDGTRLTLPLVVRDSAPPLSAESDLDGDGRSDLAEGAGDADLDGRMDFEDPWTVPSVQPLGRSSTPGQLELAVLEAEAGIRLRPGPRTVGAPGLGLALEPLAREGLGDVRAGWDALATELDGPGQVIRVVLPVPGGLPERAELRVALPDGWFAWVEDAANTVSSAPSTDGLCPRPESNAYGPGPVAGHACLRVQVEDGGPNDGDGAADREIRWLAAVIQSSVPPPGDDPPESDPPDDGPDPTDAPPGLEGEVEGACSCRSAEPTLPSLGLVVLLAGWGYARIRRRRAPVRVRVRSVKGR